LTGKWLETLAGDPLPELLSADDPALSYFTRRDLLGENNEPVDSLWNLPEARVTSARQRLDGSWHYPGKTYDPVSNTNYTLLETYRTLRVLVEMYGFQREHLVLEKAAEYVFSCQTDEGDIRGILGNQYMPYYHGAILELLIKAGYTDDLRTLKGLQWLLSMRQVDGGWLIPTQLVPAIQKTSHLWHGLPVLPDRSCPHAHIATGMVLRAFAAHAAYRKLPEVITAGERLKERLFHADKYNDRKSASFWFKFQFPFWWPNLVTVLDTLSRMGFEQQDKDISKGLDWFISNQSPDGLWDTGYKHGENATRMRRWVGLAICRVLKRIYETK
jgi:hypothetical protein